MPHTIKFTNANSGVTVEVMDCDLNSVSNLIVIFDGTRVTVCGNNHAMATTGEISSSKTCHLMITKVTDGVYNKIGAIKALRTAWVETFNEERCSRTLSEFKNDVEGAIQLLVPTPSTREAYKIPFIMRKQAANNCIASLKSLGFIAEIDH